MKGVWHSLGLWMAAALAVVILLGAACSRKTGSEGGFEYATEVWGAELTRVEQNEGGGGEVAETGQIQVRLEVPSRLGGKRVRRVAAGAFRNTDAVSVKIPWRVSEIGAEAFAGCTNLVWAELPSRLERVGDGLFRGCIRLAESDLPDRVEEIGAWAYGGCRCLKRVAFPAKLRLLGDHVFSGCAMLESVELPDGIADIPDGAFEGCRGLKSVRIPVGVTNIGARAFAGCASLEKIELPAGLRSVGDEAFAGCGLLESMAFSGSVESLGKQAFAGCTGLQSVEVAEDNPVFSSRDGVLFRDGGLELVRFPNGRGGTYAVPEGVRVVGDEAFAECGLLESVAFSGSVERLGKQAFAGCTGLQSVEVAEDNPVFSVRDGVLFRDGGTELVLCPRTRRGGYAVPGDVKRIAPGAFRGSRVETVEVPGGVGTIAEDAFRDCQCLRRVTLSEGVEELGDAAFMGCRALWEFEMPDGIKRTGKDLFAGCDGLMLLVVPDSLAGSCEAWQVPEGCTIRSRSAWEEEKKGRQPGSPIAPFYGRYTGEDLDPVAFEGTVLAASALPDPEKNDYDDCLYALLVELDSVLSSTPAGTNVERVVLVNVPVMEGRTIVRQHVFEPGDKVSCTCASYDAMPLGILEIQLSDDIQSFEHQQYYPLGIRKIPDFRGTGKRDFAKREISILPVRTLPRDENAVAARRERMQREIARIEDELVRHGGTFEAWKEEYKPIAERYGRLCEERHAGWIGDSYFAAGGPETTYDTKAYIEGLLPYKRYLEENNIDLIVARVPSRWDFAARVLAADDFRENPAWVEHQYECLKNDIEIIDPMPEMWKERFGFPLFYFYHWPAEYHPCEGTALVLGKEIADVLKRYPYPKSEPEIVLKDYLFEIEKPIFYWPGGNEKFNPSENLVLKQAVRDDEPIGVELSSGSPFLFFSGSLFWFPQGSLGASVPAYAAYFLQTFPDWFYQQGDFNPMIKHLVDPQILHFRRAIVIVGGPETWQGFPPMPRYILDGARRITLEKTISFPSDETTIDGKDSYSHSVDENGVLQFDPVEGKKEDHFDMVVNVPYMEGKHTCMVRVNTGKTSHLFVHLVEEGSDDIVDTNSFLPGRMHAADFFVPLAKPDTRVKIRFQPKDQYGLFVRNIELWYY